ncbi:MAG: glycosyltransferase family 4 protein [Chitinispirillaceae bacterium]|nr:glycosyltransferase family 4 protein [Chitinispirillaceae bacterium]
MSNFLEKEGFSLSIACEGVQERDSRDYRFRYIEGHLSFFYITKLILKQKPDIIIFFIGLRYFYLFPTLLLSKLLGKKVIHWGHGRDLQNPNALLKNIAYTIEHWIDDAIIIYAPNQKKLLQNYLYKKIFIANNTLKFTDTDIRPAYRNNIKQKYNIVTDKNIICMGRMQKRKRIEDLIDAFGSLLIKNVGLILAGPDSDGFLNSFNNQNIYILGPIYGSDSIDLLSTADVCCIPGAVGLGIVDAFYCGLPIVTENVRHGPEIMYLKEGINGFMVPQGDIHQLAGKLDLLLSDDILRKKFSEAARQEIMTNGHIDRMCEGFRDALRFVSKTKISAAEVSP